MWFGFELALGVVLACVVLSVLGALIEALLTPNDWWVRPPR